MDASYSYEKLGLLYLGRELDLKEGRSLEQPRHYSGRKKTAFSRLLR